MLNFQGRIGVQTTKYPFQQLRPGESFISMILPTYPGKIPQTSPNPTKKEIPSYTVGETSGVSSRGMWVRS